MTRDEIRNEVFRAANNCAEATVNLKDGRALTGEVAIPSKIGEGEFLLGNNKFDLKNVRSIEVNGTDRWILD